MRVLGLAQQGMDRPIRSFTVTFENPIYDEASIAEAQARHVGSTYHPIPITGREIADAFADAIWQNGCSASVFCVKPLLSNDAQAALSVTGCQRAGKTWRRSALATSMPTRCETPSHWP